ncbi:MAG: hypothetical protein QF435_10885 [Arenicellales bacterium]|nr:hypothetical protein [Arenicellales bacterium]
MPYIIVENFKGGIDGRRMDVTATPGTLVDLINAHITRGGEIEKRPAFVELCTLPSTTFGLAASADTIFTFGSTASVTLPAGAPSNMVYQRLVHPSSSSTAMTRITDVEIFNGKAYASAEYADASLNHYYDGTNVSQLFDGRASGQFTFTGGTKGAVTSVTVNSVEALGTAVQMAYTEATFSGGSGSGTTAAVTLTSGAVSSIAVTAGGTGYTSAPTVAISGGGGSSATATATISAQVASITMTGGGSGYSSSPTVSFSGGGGSGAAGTANISAGAISSVTITNGGSGYSSAPTISFSGGGGSGAAGTAVLGSGSVASIAVTAGGSGYANDTTTTFAVKVASQMDSFSSSPEYSGASDANKVHVLAGSSGTGSNGFSVVMTVAAGTASAYDITSSGTSSVVGATTTYTTSMSGGGSASGTYTPGEFVWTGGNKVYQLSESLMFFSGIETPTEWLDSSLGAGFINMSNQAAGSEKLQAMANYFQNVAIFSERAVQIWALDPDPDANYQTQVLSNTGTIAGHSVVQFGDNDVFYLSETGIRSLRARDSSNAAFVNDVGNAIDDIIRDDIASSRTEAVNAKGVIEPREGRYLLAVGTTIYAFSYFPGSKINAWSKYEPGFTVDSWAVQGEKLYCRDTNDKLYLFGGTTGTTYDSSSVTATIPFLDAGTPATTKVYSAIDLACDGVWAVNVATDPQDISLTELVATVPDTTYGLGSAAFTGTSTHIGLTLTHSSAGKAKLANLVVHYTSATAD